MYIERSCPAEMWSFHVTARAHFLTSSLPLACSTSCQGAFFFTCSAALNVPRQIIPERLHQQQVAGFGEKNDRAPRFRFDEIRRNGIPLGSLAARS